jgi:hypothetical protein
VKWSVGIETQGDRVLSRDEAVEEARAEFARAVAQAGLPEYPIVRVEAAGEGEDGDEDGSGGVYIGGEGKDSSVQGGDPGVRGGDPGVRGGDSHVQGKDSGG